MLKEIQVIDNFLSKEQFDLIFNQMTGPEFPWYYQEGKVFPDDGMPSLSHNFFFESKIWSNWFEMLVPVLQKMDMQAMRRIKANFDYKHNEAKRTGLHTDVQVGHEYAKTGILYVNKNNGGTYFEDGSMVDSVPNRFVTFPAYVKHGTQTHTDTNTRIVLNFVWY